MMQIFARTLEGETVVLEADATEEVAGLKTKIGLDSSMALSFGGCMLEDDETLDEYQVEAGSTVFCVPRLSGGGDGTPAMGKRHKKTHGLCPRCNKRSFHYQKKRCASCGYPSAKIRCYEWSKKAKRRKATGTGRMTYLKTLPRRFKNGFREGTAAPARKKAPAN